jgi:hypothetical protein
MCNKIARVLDKGLKKCYHLSKTDTESFSLFLNLKLYLLLKIIVHKIRVQYTILYTYYIVYHICNKIKKNFRIFKKKHENVIFYASIPYKNRPLKERPVS